MFKKPSLVTRIVVGKGVGLLFGLSGFALIPYLTADDGYFLRLGFLLWYITVGAMIGLCGVMTHHPLFKYPVPWWLMGIWVGSWMNLIVVFLAYDHLHSMMISLVGENEILSSPFWFVLEGAIVGLVIAYLATKLGGEGKEVLNDVD